MPIVLVELPAADAADVNAPALIAACSSGLRRGTCGVEEEPNGERAAAVAIVEWLDPEHLHARIDVGRRAEQRAGWQVRELSFHEQDALLERWRSVGLAIAGVVGEATLLEPSQPVVTPPAAPRQPPERSPVVERDWRVALGPALESGLTSHGPSAGAWLDAARSCCGSVPLELGFTAANAWSVHAPAQVETRFATLGLGLAVRLHVSEGVLLRGALFAAAEAVTASATNPSSGAHESGSRWLFGGLGRVQAAWPESGFVSGVLGLEIARLSGATNVRTFNQTVAVSPALRVGVQAGLECKF